ncbi:MAG: hypothetical protein ACRDUT_01175 [Mycobacterium sp.]
MHKWEPGADVHRFRRVIDNSRAAVAFVAKWLRPGFTDELLTRCEHLVLDVCDNLGTE